MAGEISYYLQNKFIDHVLRNTSMSSGSETWVALYTSNPTSADTGTEVSFSNGYARAYCKQAATSGSPFIHDVSISEGIIMLNAYDIAFPEPTGDWGNITYWGLRDAPTGGNLYYYGQISSGSGLITKGNQLYFKAGSLQLYYNNFYLGDKLLEHVLNNVPYTSPGTTIYGALYYTYYIPFDMIIVDGELVEGLPIGGGGAKSRRGYTQQVEVSGGGYSRQQITGWTSPTNGSTSNTGSIVFCTSASNNWIMDPTASNSTTPTPVTGLCLLDTSASIGGNILYSFVIDGGQYYFNSVEKYDKFVLNEGVIKLGMYISPSSVFGGI